VKSNSLRKNVVGRLGVATRSFVAVVVASATLALGMSVFVASPSFAAGTTSNAISVSAPPLGASVGGYYAPVATATSKDVVVVALDPTSSGCSVIAGRVTFTAAGECVITFNDVGNATYATAPQISQSIKVYADNVITYASGTTAGGVDGFYSPAATATSGDVVHVNLTSASTGCALTSAKVTFIKQGTCRIVLSDPGNGAYAAAPKIAIAITVYTANIMHPSTAPATAVINGAYQASASASSKDSVVITLDPKSVGCGIVVQRVTFTANGLCIVDFNDAGNGAFPAAKQIQQDIEVGTGGPKIQAAIYVTSLNAIAGKTLILNSGGGSGIGAVAYATTTGSANCSLRAGVLSYSRVGTCSVTVTKAADATYLAANPESATVHVNLASSPFANRVSAAVTAGRTQQTIVLGRSFYGVPRVVSNVASTRVTVVSASGSRLVLRVSVAKNSPRGMHTFTLTFAHGQRTSVIYIQH
jgi:hypothetical protein